MVGLALPDAPAKTKFTVARTSSEALRWASAVMAARSTALIVPAAAMSIAHRPSRQCTLRDWQKRVRPMWSQTPSPGHVPPQRLWMRRWNSCKSRTRGCCQAHGERYSSCFGMALKGWHNPCPKFHRPGEVEQSLQLEMPYQSGLMQSRFDLILEADNEGNWGEEDANLKRQLLSEQPMQFESRSLDANCPQCDPS